MGGLFFLFLTCSLTVFRKQREASRGGSCVGPRDGSRDGPPALAEKACCASALLSSTYFASVLSTLTILWGVVGLVSALGSSREDVLQSCEHARSYFWYLLSLVMVNVLLCSCGNISEIHRQRPAKPAPPLSHT